jgi:hypothetical protein
MSDKAKSGLFASFVSPNINAANQIIHIFYGNQVQKAI